MVQILDRQPSFLETLTPSINRAATSVTEGFKKRSQNQNDERLLNEIKSGNFSSPMEAVSIAARLSPEKAKYVSEFINEQAKQQSAIQLAVAKEEAKQQAVQNKQFQEKSQSQAGIQKTFNVAASMLQKNLAGIGISPLTKIGASRKGVENRAAFNNLKGKFEAILLPLESKGALSKPRFDFIISQVPSASDSQRVIAGKLRGLAETLSQEGFPIDTKILDSIKGFSEDLKGLGSEEQERPPLESFLK